MAKLDYMQSIESYLNENQVYELFEELLKQVVVSRPDNPLQFILSKIKANRSKYLSLGHQPKYKQFLSICRLLKVKFKNAPLSLIIHLTQTIYFILIGKRIFLTGAPGSCRQENLEALSEYFEWKRISVGKLLREHVQSSGPHSDRITACFNNFQMGK